MVNVQRALDDAQRLYLQRRARAKCPGCGEVHGVFGTTPATEHPAPVVRT